MTCLEDCPAGQSVGDAAGISPADAAEKLLRGRGLTIREISHRTGLTWWRVYKLAKRRGIPIRGRWMTDDEKRQAVRLVEFDGLAIKAAAATIGVSEMQVWRLIQSRREQQLRAATESFAPKRLRVAQVCPRHGAVYFAPCVACMAESRRR